MSTNTIHCDIVSAEGEIFSGEVAMVFAKGEMGELRSELSRACSEGGISLTDAMRKRTLALFDQYLILEQVEIEDLTDEQGRAKCVACGLCPQICPANCIKLVPGEDEQGNRYPLIYEIDEFRCIFCGYCQEVCPEEAIHVGTHYENSEYSRDRFVYDLERLSAQVHPVSTLWDPADPRGE